MLGKMCAKGIDQLRSLTDEEVSRPEKHGASLLGFSLWNHEPHRRPVAASTIASASAASFFCRLTKGLT
jgi:hypothetical protein